MQGQTIYKKGQKGSPVVVSDPHEDIRIFKTTDYDRFVFAKENRPIYQAHLAKIEESIADNGYLKERPIDVVKRGSELIITDGQHRFMACKELGIPVYYVIKDDSPEEMAKAIRVVNAYSRSWKDPDYLNHFVALGYPPYVQLQKFMEKHDLGISATMGLLKVEQLKDLNLTGTQDLKHAFRTGNLTFDDKAIETASEIIGPVNEIRNFHERLMPIRRQPGFIKALVIMTSSHRYEHERFLKNLATNIVSCVYCTSVGKYLQVLESIYNYKRKDGTRIYLSRKGMTPVGRDEEETT